jgi:hypothetical protein
MAHFLTNDDEYRDLIYDDDYRSYLMARSNSSVDYRFGRTRKKRARVHARNALRRVNGYLKNMIEAIANAKLRRMERELELRGIRLDRPNSNWVTRESRRQNVRDEKAGHPARPIRIELFAWSVTCHVFHSQHPLLFPFCAAPSAL